MGCKSTTNKHQAAADEKFSKDAIKVTVKYNGKDEGTQNHNLDEKLLEVLQDKLKGKVNLSENGLVNLTDIEKEILSSQDANIRNLLQKDDGQSGRSAVLKEENGKLIVQIVLHGLQNIAENVEEVYHKTNLIGKPSAEEEEKILIYDKTTGDIVFEQFLTPEGGRVFTESSAYCNGNNHLYISGGQANKQVLDTIYDVDLTTREITLVNSRLSQPRNLHSMIYIPNNYVFIVGGQGTKKVEYYSLGKKEVFPHSELNEEKIEPTLVIVNNSFLYAFTRFFYHEGKPDLFERINLKSNKKVWDLITPKIDFEYEGQILTQNYFTVCYHTPGHLIFLGGDCSEDDKCYLYDYENDTLKLSEVPNQQFESGEKFFYPTSENDNYLIPNFEQENINILHYDAKEGITKISFAG